MLTRSPAVNPWAFQLVATARVGSESRTRLDNDVAGRVARFQNGPLATFLYRLWRTTRSQRLDLLTTGPPYFVLCTWFPSTTPPWHQAIDNPRRSAVAVGQPKSRKQFRMYGPAPHPSALVPASSLGPTWNTVIGPSSPFPGVMAMQSSIPVAMTPVTPEGGSAVIMAITKQSGAPAFFPQLMTLRRLVRAKFPRTRTAPHADPLAAPARLQSIVNSEISRESMRFGRPPEVKGCPMAK